MALQAVSTAPKSVVNSPSSGFNMATSFMNLLNVTPVVSQTSSKTGALVCARLMDGGASNDVEDWCNDDDVARGGRVVSPAEKAPMPDVDRNRNETMNFIVRFDLICFVLVLVLVYISAAKRVYFVQQTQPTRQEEFALSSS